jgi:hypothetical protein
MTTWCWSDTVWARTPPYGAFEGLERDAEERIFFPDPADAIRDFFPDVDAETGAWAASQLKPQSTAPHRTSTTQ